MTRTRWMLGLGVVAAALLLGAGAARAFTMGEMGAAQALHGTLARSERSVLVGVPNRVRTSVLTPRVARLDRGPTRRRIGGARYGGRGSWVPASAEGWAYGSSTAWSRPLPGSGGWAGLHDGRGGWTVSGDGRGSWVKAEPLDW